MDEVGPELSPAEGYAAWAAFYDDDGNPLTAIEGPAVRDRLGDVAGRVVLDVGSGTGRHAVACAEAGARVVALDASPEMLRVGRARSTRSGGAILHARHALPGPLPIADRSVDAVVLGLVVEHVADLVAALIECRRVLATDGRLIASGLHPDRTATGQRARFIDPATGHRRPIRTIHRTESDLRRAADLAGLECLAWDALVVDPTAAHALPRAGRYAGLNLGWVGVWKRGDDDRRADFD